MRQQCARMHPGCRLETNLPFGRVLQLKRPGDCECFVKGEHHVSRSYPLGSQPVRISANQHKTRNVQPLNRNPIYSYKECGKDLNRNLAQVNKK